MVAPPVVSAVREFTDLAGLELGSICFVRDYVEFHFDGPILRSLAEPKLQAGDVRIAFPDRGSRDALCELIGQVVDDANDLPDRLSLRFRNGAVIDIPKANKGAGAEVANFIPVVDGRRVPASMIVWENQSWLR